MSYNIRWLFLLFALALAVGCGSGCGKDWEARKVRRQAEAGRSLYDFNQLLRVLLQEQDRLTEHTREACRELQGQDRLTEHTREACRELAEDILQEKLAGCIREKDTESLRLLLQKMNDESVKKLINTDRVNGALQELWLRELQTMMSPGDGTGKMPAIYPSRFEDWALVIKQIMDDDIRKAGIDLLAVALVCGGRELPETLPDLYEMCHTQILHRCSECRGAGRMRCYSCHKGSRCRLCNPSELPRQEARPNRYYLPSYRTRQTPDCRHCSGDGHMAESCRACRGRKYHVDKRKLLRYYKGQLIFFQQQLQEALEKRQDLPDVKRIGTGAENAQDSR